MSSESHETAWTNDNSVEKMIVQSATARQDTLIVAVKVSKFDLRKKGGKTTYP